jgi:hypothetical protein
MHIADEEHVTVLRLVDEAPAGAGSKVAVQVLPESVSTRAPYPGALALPTATQDVLAEQFTPTRLPPELVGGSGRSAEVQPPKVRVATTWP